MEWHSTRSWDQYRSVLVIVRFLRLNHPPPTYCTQHYASGYDTLCSCKGIWQALVT